MGRKGRERGGEGRGREGYANAPPPLKTPSATYDTDEQGTDMCLVTEDKSSYK